MRRARHRLAVILTTAALTMAVAAGCAPEPAPTPTPTGFASEEEAFAAAEATYRAYVDAVNERRKDPDSPIDPLSFLTGNALEADIATQRDLRTLGVQITGPTEIISQRFVEASDVKVTVDICLDSSLTRVFDEDGSDATPDERVEVVGVRVHMSNSTGTLRITDSETSPEQC